MRPAVIVAVMSLLGLSIPSPGVHADYRGPLGGQTTVAQILNKPKDGATVVLSGTIVRKVGSKKYVFRDQTGEIPVTIKDKLFPAQPVDDKTKVEIAGEVEKDFRKPAEIDVDSMRILAGTSSVAP